MRQEASNTFSEGMIKDLNPLNTPNTVLTDCLNGTIITYDGNEYSLQNDMGNYGLKNCKLRPNYVPVGIAEHAGILYIASYNPIDERFELGSYPSTLLYEEYDTSLRPVTKPFTTVTLNDTYTNLVKTYSTLYILRDLDPKKYKIHPGDEYYVSYDGSYSSSQYAKLMWEVMDDELKTHDVSDIINLCNGVSDNNFEHVKWEVPGWLGFKWHIAEVDEINVTVRTDKVPQYIDGSTNADLYFRFQIITSDPLITSVSNPDFHITATIKFGDSIQNIKCSNTSHDGWTIKTIDLLNGSKVYYYEYPLTGTISVNSGITVTTSVRLYDGVKWIEYDHLSGTKTFDVITSKSLEAIKLADSKWQYTTYPKDRIDIQFSTDGIDAIVSDGSLTVKYDVKYWNESDWAISLSDTELPEWDMSNNYCNFSIPLSRYDGTNNNAIIAENLYKFTFTVWCNGNKTTKFTSKILLSSVLMNGSGESDYENVGFDTWMSKYSTYIKNKRLELVAGRVPKISPMSLARPTWDGEQAGDGGGGGISIPSKNNYDFGSTPVTELNTEGGIDVVYNHPDFTTFIPDKSYKKLGNKYTISAEKEIDIVSNCKASVELLCGPIWDGLLTSSSVELIINKIQCSAKFTKLGLVDYEESNCFSVNDTIKVSVGLDCEIETKLSGNLWVYSNKELKVNDTELGLISYIREVTYSGSAAKVTQRFTSTNGSSVSIKSCVDSLISTLKKDCDIALLHITISGIETEPRFTGSNKWGIVNAIINKQSSEFSEHSSYKQLEINFNKTNTSESKTYPFLAIAGGRDRNSLMLFDIESGKWNANDVKSMMTNIAKDIHHVRTTSNVVFGHFINIKIPKDVTNVVPNTKFKAEGRIVFGKLNYSGYNLFDSPDRASFTEKIKPTCKNFISKSEFYKIDDTSFTKVEEKVTIDESELTELKNTLESKRKNIEDRNTKSETEATKYYDDGIYRNNNSDLDSFIIDKLASDNAKSVYSKLANDDSSGQVLSFLAAPWRNISTVYDTNNNIRSEIGILNAVLT